jgi:putative endonuclease
MVSPKQKFGHEIEELALNYLLGSGLNLETTNYFCQGGEIDIIMKDNDILVFVEVRYRQDNDYGGAVASITKGKRSKIIKAAKVYLQEKNLWDKVLCRFDVLLVQDHQQQDCLNNVNDEGARKILWLKDAFWINSF